MPLSQLDTNAHAQGTPTHAVGLIVHRRMLRLGPACGNVHLPECETQLAL